MGAKIDKLYTGCGHHHHESYGKMIVRKFYTWWLSANVKNRKQIYSEIDKLPADQVSPKLFNHSAQYLDSSITSVLNSKYGDERFEMSQSIRRNAHDFAIFRTAIFTEKLRDKTKVERTAILDEYERQLKVEADMASRSSRGAIQWQEYERTKDVYPNLEYLESRSVEKNEAHVTLYGTVKPIDDPFWDDHFPPLQWGCKCRTRKSDGEVSTADVPEVPKAVGIAGNAGKQQQVFTKEHPFIKSVSNGGKRILQDQLEVLKKDVPYGKPDVYLKNKSTVNVHLYADDVDLEQNFDAAKTIGQSIPKTEIKIAPHANIENVKNPEYLINGKIGDLKVQSGKTVKNNISNAVAQGCEVIVIRLDDNYPFSLERFKQQVNGALKIRSGQIKRVLIIDKDGSVTDYKP